MKIKLSKGDSKILKERMTLCLEAGRAVTGLEVSLRVAAMFLSEARATKAKIKSIQMQDLSAAVFEASKFGKTAGDVFRTMERGPRRPRYAVAEARAMVIEKNAADLNRTIRKNPKVKAGNVPELRKGVAGLIGKTRDLWDVTRLICENPADEVR